MLSVCCGADFCSIVPLIVNIWGFVIQLTMTINKTPPSFTLAMFDTIFACLDGKFCARLLLYDDGLTYSLCACE